MVSKRLTRVPSSKLKPLGGFPEVSRGRAAPVVGGAAKARIRVIRAIPAGQEIYSLGSLRRYPGNFGRASPVSRTAGNGLYFINQHQETDMANRINRREFLQLAALGSVGVGFASALPGMARADAGDDFFFLQLSDTHWGFEG